MKFPRIDDASGILMQQLEYENEKVGGASRCGVTSAGSASRCGVTSAGSHG